MPMMPSQGAPMPPNAEPKDQGGSDPMQLLEDTQSALTLIASLFDSTESVPPEAKQKMGMIVEEFSSLMSQVMQSAGGGKAPGKPASGPAEMNAGGNPNARPM